MQFLTSLLREVSYR